MGKGKRKPRKRKQSRLSKQTWLELFIGFFLGVLGNVVASLITDALDNLLG